jgi:histidinol dehydrogenase
VLVTDSMALAEAVQQEVERQVNLLPRVEIASASIRNNGMILIAKDLDAAVEAANQIAPEHLELCVDEPFALLGKVRNAGSVFLGRYCPEALGDYLAGPNHTLPTSGTARFSNPLSVDDFVKKSSIVYYSEEALRAVHTDIETFAKAEELTAHANSVAVRFE